MPQPGQPPYNDKVEDLTGQPAAVAAQRDVHILPEPGAQRDMPPPPVFGNAAGKIRVVEIFQEFKAQHPSQADGHIGVAGKIKVDLKGKGNSAQPGGQRGQAFPRQGGHGIPQQAHLVGQQHLFAQPHRKAVDAAGKKPGAFLPADQLPLHCFVLHNRPGDQLREQRDIGAEGNGVFLRCHRPAVNIDDVAERLEGVKADADGQCQFQQGQVAAGQGVHALHQQVGVLKDAQRPDIPRDAENKDRLGPSMLLALLQGGHRQSAQVVEQDGGKHQPDIHRLSPGVKKQAGQQQPQVAQHPRTQVIDPDHQGEKQEQEGQTAEYHKGSLQAARAAGEGALRSPWDFISGGRSSAPVGSPPAAANLRRCGAPAASPRVLRSGGAKTRQPKYLAITLSTPSASSVTATAT